MNELFDRKALQKLILPLIIEQVLAVSVGMSDIIMVSAVGQSAMSGVSLVDIIAVLLIQVFSALATGGAVISAQYLGQKNLNRACMAANQLILSIGVLSTFIAVLALIGNPYILSTIYGQIEPDVMKNARIYFYITALSYPFLGIYNGAAALCRSMGNSKASMNTSLIMNGINLGGNAFLVFGLKLGVEGVAIPTLVSRIIAATVMLIIIHDQKNPIHINAKFRLGFQPKIIKEILCIGIPTGLDSSLFQIGKILVASLVSTFGTNAIAANAVGNTIASFEVIPGSAIGLAMITVVGQTLGAKQYDEARRYIKKLMKISYCSLAILNITILLSLNLILGFYRLTPEAFTMARQIIIVHGVFCIFLWTPSFSLPNALRAGGDAKFIMLISIFSMWTFRIGFSYLLSLYFHLGLLGVWVAMLVDWLFRSIVFRLRFRTDKWIHHLSDDTL